jgi:hypothetical protein
MDRGFDLGLDDSKPESCKQAGLDCRNCIRQSAANLAALIPGMGVDQLASTFSCLYPDPGCLPMLSAFDSAYHLEQKARAFPPRVPAQREAAPAKVRVMVACG